MSLIDRLYAIHELPALPEVVLQLREMIASDTSNAQAIAKVIEQDVALAAKVLKISNSAYFSPSKRISSVQHAIAQIGFNEICNMVTTVSLINQFPGTSMLINYRQFWRHSLTAGNLARNIGKMAESNFTPEELQQLFFAGLMHDIGILLLDQFFHTEFKMVIDKSIKKSQSFLAVETDLTLHDTHGWLGGALLELWKLDMPIVSGVKFHHDPMAAPVKQRKIAAVVFLAEYILCDIRPDAFEGKITGIPDALWHDTGLTADALPLLYENALLQVEKADLVLADSGL